MTIASFATEAENGHALGAMAKEFGGRILRPALAICATSAEQPAGRPNYVIYVMEPESLRGCVSSVTAQVSF